ncbi:MAG: HAMP domain-containing histidine kinase [Bacteroidia bacterium]|nr:HAMP domain-containing histidine kinase [Bacteroidia bacterium]
MLGWLWLLLPVWESWMAPLSRWGSYAFPIVAPGGKVFVVDGQRLWTLERGQWQELPRLPEEVRAGVALSEDTLLLGGLNVLLWGKADHLMSVRIPGIGWIYRMWHTPEGIAVRGAQASVWISIQGGKTTIYPVSGEWIGIGNQGPLLHTGDSIRYRPHGVAHLLRTSSSWHEIIEIAGQLWGITQQGEVGLLSSSSLEKEKGRMWIGPYLLTETEVKQWPERTSLWKGTAPIYAAAWDPITSIVCLLTSHECICLYPQVPIHWTHRWPLPMTQCALFEEQWIVWQGETAVSHNGVRRYTTTLIEPTRYQGKWLWATPKGLMWEHGEAFLEPGHYVSTVAARGEWLAWAAGVEVAIYREGRQDRYRFPHPIRKLAWRGDQLWAWRADQLYVWQNQKWRLFRLPFQPEEGIPHKGSWYFRVGEHWLQVREGRVIDTLLRPPGLAELPPLPLNWGRPLASSRKGDTLYVFTSLGLLRYVRGKGKLPPIRLKASLKGPALEKKEKQRFRLPAERPYIEIDWEGEAPFLPAFLQVWYQVGEEAPRRFRQPSLLLSLSQPGEIAVRVWAEHPWYPSVEKLEWEIEVFPPWYETGIARLSAVFLLILLVGGIAALREWNLRRVQQRLTAEREALLHQTQSQQAQLLRAERMANLGLMAAHIAHEINTPLGVIRTALTEMRDAMQTTRPPLPRPNEPRPSPTRLRELRTAWLQAHPTLSPKDIQQVASLGFTPDQWPIIAPFLQDEEKWNQFQAWLSAEVALLRAQEAADRLHSRVQAIRTYVRGIEDLPTTSLSLAESLHSTLAFYKPLFRQIEATLEVPEEPLYVSASPARLEQVWANLIQNALQAMPEGGKLTIRVEKEGEKARILFQDTGKGIPPALWETIFEPLFTTKAPGEGTGLGLPLCKQIIESYGGNLRLLHSEPGFTLFGVELPLTSPGEKA